MAAVKDWTQKQALARPENDHFQLGIEDSQGVLVGLINTHDVDRRVGIFHCGVAVRGEHRRRGYAAEAILILIRYMFDHGHHRITATHSANTGFWCTPRTRCTRRSWTFR